MRFRQAVSVGVLGKKGLSPLQMARVGKFAFFPAFFFQELHSRSARGGMERAQGNPHNRSLAGLDEETAKQLTADIIVLHLYLYTHLHAHHGSVCSESTWKPLQPKSGPPGTPGAAPWPWDSPALPCSTVCCFDYMANPWQTPMSHAQTASVFG